MTDAPRSNRPTPRTAAAVEAELKRRIRAELTQARADADGELDDAALASVIAGAIGAALSWHLESPEHTRNATISSRTWRPAGGPRGGARPGEIEDRPSFEDQGGRPFGERPPRPPYPPRPPFQERGPRQYDQRDAPPRREPRDFDDREFPSRGPQGRPPFSPRGGGGNRPPSSGGGFAPRRGGSGGRPPSGGRGGGGGGFGPRRAPPRGR